jgi:hypothetical protein
MKSRQVIPKRPSSDTSGTLLSLVMKDVCGTGDEAVGKCGMDARKGFPDDMLEVKSNALFYVHGRSLSEAVWSSCGALRLALMVVGALQRSAPTCLGQIRDSSTPRTLNMLGWCASILHYDVNCRVCPCDKHIT